VAPARRTMTQGAARATNVDRASQRRIGECSVLRRTELPEL
jgi:hypothetical protein